MLVPYWRDGDVQREADLIEEVARIHGLDNFPATPAGAPARRRAGSRTSSASRRRLEDALRDRGLTETISWSFTRPRDHGGAAARRRAAAAPGQPAQRGPERRCARCSCRACSTPRATTLPAGGRGWRCSSPRTSTACTGRCPAGGDAPRARRAARRRAPPPRRAGHGAHPPAGARRRAGGLLLASRRCSRRRARDRRPGVVDGARRAALPASRPGGHRAGGRGERTLGWIGELHPLVARAVGPPEAAGGLRDRRRPAGRAVAPSVRRYEPISTFPAVIQDIAVVVPEDVPCADVEYAVTRGGRATCSSAARCSTSTAASRWARATSRWRCGSTFRAPDRTLTDEEVAERRAADRARAGRDRRQAPCLSRRGSPSAARPASRARSAQRSCSGTRSSS